MNLPNKITLARIAFIPIFIIVLYLPLRCKHIIAAALFIIISSTDALDGYIARKRKEITTLGKFIDPLADKLLISAALIFLIGHGVEAWMAFVIIAREFMVTGIRIIAASHKKVIAASNLGKIKTLSQIIAVVAVLLNSSFGWYIMLIAVLFTIVSGIDYLMAALKFLKG
jgi:CDP-diacylglycerol--glycerol-3-phosphate 3-phosphatidyltransferase